jgi:DNA-binding FadR family transcriptional regulator
MITEAEILEQISKSIEDRQKAEPDDDPTSFTTRELSEIVNVSEKKLRELLRIMIASGDVEPTRVYRQSITGSYQRSPAYKFKIK